MSERARERLRAAGKGREIFPLLKVKRTPRIETASPAEARGRNIPDDVFSMLRCSTRCSAATGGDLSGGQQQQLAIGRALGDAAKRCCCSTSRPRASSPRSSRTSAEPSPICASRQLAIVLGEKFRLCLQSRRKISRSGSRRGQIFLRQAEGLDKEERSRPDGV